MNTDITKQMEMVLYRTEDDNVTVSALIKDETIWLTQKAMAELFGIDKSGISRHLAKIFETGELDEEVVVAKISTIFILKFSINNAIYTIELYIRKQYVIFSSKS